MYPQKVHILPKIPVKFTPKGYILHKKKSEIYRKTAQFTEKSEKFTEKVKIL